MKLPTKLNPSTRLHKPGEGLRKIALAARAGVKPVKPVKPVAKPTVKSVSRRIPKKPKGA
jgi:hypothetical protein